MIEQIRRAITETGGGALFFSGGLDSSIIAQVLKNSKIEFRCFTSGIRGSKDIVWAEKASKSMGLGLETILVNDYEHYLKRVLSEFNFSRVVDVAIGVPFFAACEKASKYSKNGITGLGADEVFAGYGSHKRLYPDFGKIDEECKKRVENVKKDLERDKKIASYFKMGLSTPFLNKKVVSKGLEMPSQEKINKNMGKLVLRKIAIELGVPEEIANRGKKAFQYGSGSLKMLRKYAKKQGFRTIKGLLQKI